MSNAQYPQQRISGGSSSERGGRHTPLGYFQPGINQTFMSTQKPDRRFRFLPAFDTSLPFTDTNFRTSVVPYRVSNSATVDEDTKSEPFADFYLQFEAWSGVGRSQADFIARRTLSRFGAPPGDLADPMTDMFNVAKTSPRDDWHALTLGVKNPKTGYDDHVLPSYPWSKVVSDTLYNDDVRNPSGWREGLLTYAPASLKDLKRVLSLGRTAACQPIMPGMWGDKYQFGDITDPQYGLLARARKHNGPPVLWKFEFSPNENSNMGVEPYPLSAAGLTERHDLGSMQTLCFHSYQTIVDWMCSDGAFPRDLIQHACGHAANVPPAVNQPTFATAATGFPGAPAAQQPYQAPAPAYQHPLPAAYDTQQPQSHLAPPLSYPAPVGAAALPAGDQIPMGGPPPAPFTPPPPPAAPPQPQLPAGLFWVSVNKVVQPAAMAAQAILDFRDPEALVVLQGDPDQNWKTLVQAGIVAAAPPPPVAVAPPAPPAAPVYQQPAPPQAAPYQPPAQPQAAPYQPPAAAPYQPPAQPQAPAGALPASHLTPEETAELASLRARSVADASSMNPMEFTRIATLIQKSITG